MKNQLKHLNKGQIFSPSSSINFQVLSGEVWATIEGDETDYVLKRGERLQVPENRLVLIEALMDASFAYNQSDASLEIGA